MSDLHPSPGASWPAEEAYAGHNPDRSGDELEELILPSLLQPPEPLPPGTVLGPEGRLRLQEQIGMGSRINRYVGEWRDDAGQVALVEVREGPADHPGLGHEAEILAGLQYAMLPAFRASFEADGRRYLVLDRTGGDSLAVAIGAGLEPEQALSVVLQLAQVVRRLHMAGWALLGLSPADVQLGQPVRLTQLSHAARIGEAVPHALQVSGYSAPELARREVVTGKEDVYSLRAILYHALAGQPLSETGGEVATLPFFVHTPGGPQLLVGALAPDEARLDLEAFYQGLLALRQRLLQLSIGLEVGSATTVGLNPTRLVNEDSCGYAVWSVAAAEGAIFRALLCVADGMGGMDAGEVASRAALNAVLTAATGPFPLPAIGEGGTVAGEGPPPLDPVALIRLAAPAVHAAGQGREMGTTITCVAVQGGTLTLGHVGDTRAYLLRSGELTQLTADHSLVAAMVSSGVLSREEARGHPDSNKVLRSLGGRRELPEGYVDSLQQAAGRPSLPLEPGDWILVCSDGVWGQVDDGQIQAVLSSADGPPAAAEELVDRALREGAPDNASAVVARCVRMRGW